MIANEDISLLAEHFSEPAFATLFEVVSSGAKEQTGSLSNSELIDLELNQDTFTSEEDQTITSTQIAQATKIQTEPGTNSNTKTMSIFDRTNSTKRILPAVTNTSEHSNPYLVLKNIFQETETSKKKKQRKQERNVPNKLNANSNTNKQEMLCNNNLNCLASAASILSTPVPNNQEKEASNQFISPMKDITVTNSPRRSKTIRQIIEIDKEEISNQRETGETERTGTLNVSDVNSGENLTKIASSKKRNSKTKLQKSDYFDDFFENIKDMENND